MHARGGRQGPDGRGAGVCPKERYAAGEKGPAVGIWREIGGGNHASSGKPAFDLARYKAAAQMRPPRGVTRRARNRFCRHRKNRNPSRRQQTTRTASRNSAFDMDATSRAFNFRHRFRGGITCEATVDLDKLHTGRPRLRCEWSERPKLRVVAEYRQWTRSGNESLTRRASRSSEALQSAPRLWELCFEPGRAPVKVK